MTLENPGIVLITGIMASGKSTVAQALAERLPKSVHVRGDLFRKMVVNGRVDMQPEFSLEAMEQLRVRYRLAAAAALEYCLAGFAVVIQDVVIGPVLEEVIGYLKGEHPLYVVVLCPTPDVVRSREAERTKVGYRSWPVDDMDSGMRTSTPHVGMWLDNSRLSVDATVDAILARLSDAAITG